MYAKRGADLYQPAALALDARAEIAVLQPTVVHEPLIEAERADGGAAERHVAAVGRNIFLEPIMIVRPGGLQKSERVLGREIWAANTVGDDMPGDTGDLRPRSEYVDRPREPFALREEIVVEKDDELAVPGQLVKDGVALTGEFGLAGDDDEIGRGREALDVGRLDAGDEDFREARSEGADARRPAARIPAGRVWRCRPLRAGRARPGEVPAPERSGAPQGSPSARFMPPRKSCRTVHEAA